MAKVKVSQLDVWIVESNTVYQAVPFSVVTDWIVQGRLLAEDRIRPAGTPDWFPISGVKQLAAYLPQPEPAHADDQAEALEMVAFDVPYKRPRAEEDDEVDMIPLIDVSLVLLIFFMMLLAGSAAAMTVQLPTTAHGEAVPSRERADVTVLVSYGKDEEVAFGVLSGKKPVAEKLEDPNEVVDAVKALMEAAPTAVDLTINADERVASGKVRDLVARLTIVPEIRTKIRKLYTGTGGK